MFTVAALYHFTRFPDPAALQGPLAEVCAAGRVTGTLLLAQEGINGTIAGPRDSLVDHRSRVAGAFQRPVALHQA